MKAFVISLKRAAERRRFMQKQLHALGIDFEIVDAVDYKEMTEADFDRLTDRSAITDPRFITNGTLACALSHVKAMQAIIGQGLHSALILEDDAILPANFKGTLDRLEHCIAQDEIISLSYYHPFERDAYLSNHNLMPVGDNVLATPVNLHHIGSAMAYIMTCNTAQKLVQVAMPIRVNADWWGVFYDKKAFTSFRCLYPNQLQPEFFGTTLDYLSTTSIKSKVAAWVRKFRIPMLYQYLRNKNRTMLREKYSIHLVDQQPFNQVD